MHPEYLRFSRRYHSPSSLVGSQPSTAAVHPASQLRDLKLSTASQEQKLRDDKMSFRFDNNSGRWGQLSGYYFYDNFQMDNPILLVREAPMSPVSTL